MDPINANWWSQPNSNAATPGNATSPNEAPVQGQVPSPAGAPGIQQVQQSTPTQQPNGQQAGESNQDYAARIAALEAERDAARQQAMQANAAVQDAIQAAQQFRQQQDARAAESFFTQERERIIQQAENFAPQERSQWLASNLSQLDQARNQFWMQQVQQISQAREQDRVMLGTPLFVDTLIKQHGLPEAARAELMDLAQFNPDLAAQRAPGIKERYGELESIRNQLNQLSRTNQANQLRDQGAGIVGGQQPTGVPSQPSSDPDIKAMQIYAAIKRGTYQPG